MAQSATPGLSLIEEASGWYALSLSDEVTDAELAALDEWLGADARHADAFDRVALTARQVQAMSGLAHLVAAEAVAREAPAVGGPAAPTGGNSLLGEGAPAQAANDDARDELGARRAWHRRPVVRWGLASGLAASIALVVGLSTIGGAPSGIPVGTAVAQTRVLTLADGSRITLGPSTRIATYMGEDARRITLVSGEAFFEVAHDRTRPFWVEAGDSRIQVVGTKFDVSRSSGRVEVSVLEGVVKIHEPAAILGRSKVRTLTATQRVETVDAGSLFTAPPSLPITVDPVPAGDWRNGRLTYIDRRLGDVVDDLNRYYPPGVRLADPGLADLRVAIGLRPSEMDALVEGLPLIAPVRVEKNAAGRVTIERAPRGR